MQGFIQYLMSFDVPQITMFVVCLASLFMAVVYLYSGVNFNPTAAFSTTGARRQSWGGLIALLIFTIMASTLFFSWFGAEKKKIEDAQKNETFHVIENAAKIPGNPFEAFAELGEIGGLTLGRSDFSSKDPFLTAVTEKATKLVTDEGDKNSLTALKAIRIQTDLEYKTIPLVIVTYDGTDGVGDEYEGLEVEVELGWDEDKTNSFVDPILKKILTKKRNAKPANKKNSKTEVTSESAEDDVPLPQVGPINAGNATRKKAAGENK